MQIKNPEFKRGIRGTNDILTEEKLQVAFIGRSNVGKSSVINYLVNSTDLVKSGKTPGKTREINFFLVNSETYFVDLPGYGYAKMSIEEQDQLQKMIQWYFFEPVFKRKTVLILDAKVGITKNDLEMLRLLRDHNADIIIVANKIDKLNQKERSEQLRNFAEIIPGATVIPCSTTERKGRNEILEAISQ